MLTLIFVVFYRLGSLIVDYTVVMKDKAEAVQTFSQASMELAQGSTLEVFNQNLGINKMTTDNNEGILKFYLKVCL